MSYIKRRGAMYTIPRLLRILTIPLLLNFFKTDAGTSRWFLKPREPGRVTPLPK
jgi:hypothetical protein